MISLIIRDKRYKKQTNKKDLLASERSIYTPVFWKVLVSKIIWSINFDFVNLIHKIENLDLMFIIF